jgi:hypothetical protein
MNEKEMGERGRGSSGKGGLTAIVPIDEQAFNSGLRQR